MEPYLQVFEALRLARADAFSAAHGLIVKSGEGLGAAIIKLQKPSWTTDSGDALVNTNGLFFSVWIDPAAQAQGRVRYNLHAKKLRLLKRPDFPAREFARTFRTGMLPALAAWPNLTFPKGPVTLFEGWVPLHHSSLASETSALLDRFVAITPAIEALLAATDQDRQPATSA